MHATNNIPDNIQMRSISGKKNKRRIYNKGIREEDHPVGRMSKSFRMFFEK